MRVTINNINKAIEKYGYEIVRGYGYFYFWPLSDDIPLLYDSSVYTCHLTIMNVDEWVEQLEYKIKNI